MCGWVSCLFVLLVCLLVCFVLVVFKAEWHVPGIAGGRGERACSAFYRMMALGCTWSDHVVNRFEIAMNIMKVLFG